MSSNTGRFWLGAVLMAAGAMTIFGLNELSGIIVTVLGVATVLLLTTGTLLVGTSGSTENGEPA
ncbi:hypothetical protein VB773_13705 [Haloarculaceae archaeon H-GB2-1]|nr:hypothetical protein [Haloarculaceae archaeon H-GB1-1]MEA5387018.1 hypothetical protein [Haloarculaceae archaeon H-GB11]MEA5408520.1 hypothetical protein [Haloarculaceae archaeon H-GB2-1]